MADIFVRDTNLIALMERSGYNITQENGQRKFGPPPGWTGPPPQKGSEIFIGKLPRNVYEPELVPLCQRFGTIFELRLMMEYNGENRGYAFVTYTTADEATTAIKSLDNFEIRPGRHIGVCKSIDNCRLFVGGIPKDKSKEDISNEVGKYTEGVSKVILYSSVEDKSRNRGFAFVEYESHRAAAMARRKLLTIKIRLFDQDIAVDWAQPEAQVEEETMRRFLKSLGKRQTHPEVSVTVLYVRNLSNKTTEEQLHIVFSMGGAMKIERVKKLRDFAFIHYYRREDAETALERFDGMMLDGCVIEVTWAKPPEAHKLKLEKSAGCLYRSLNYDGLDSSFEINLPPSPISSLSLLSRSSLRQRMQMANFGNLPSSFTVTKPVQLLTYLCSENNWGSPIFHVSRIDSDVPEMCYICWVAIQTPQFQGRRFLADRIGHSPDEAKHYAACFVLRKWGVIDCDYSYVAATPLTYPNLSKNCFSANNGPILSKSASTFGLCTPPKTPSFQSLKSSSPPNFFCEQGQGDAGGFLSNASTLNTFDADNLENFPPLLDPDTPIEPNSILGILSSLAAASNMDLPLFNKPKL